MCQSTVRIAFESYQLSIVTEPSVGGIGGPGGPGAGGGPGGIGEGPHVPMFRPQISNMTVHGGKLFQ
jgi:hypothetical protein